MAHMASLLAVKSKPIRAASAYYMLQPLSTVHDTALSRVASSIKHGLATMLLTHAY